MSTEHPTANRSSSSFEETITYHHSHLWVCAGGPGCFLPTHDCGKARAAVLRELREEVANLSEWLSTCRCFVINPKFGEGQPGGHFTDCAWAQESDVRDEILAAIDRRLAP